MATKRPSFPKVVVFVNGLVPLAMLAVDAARGSLGANPVEFVLRTTGLLALFFVALSLAVTPGRRVLGVPSLAVHRRALGLFAFFYACLHLVTYTVFDKGLSASAVVADTFQRPFITVGMASFLMMVPLAATSTNAMIKRLGGRQWRRLHRLAYVVGAGGVLHFYMLVKADVRTPLLYAAVVGSLLLFRAVVALRDRRPRPSRAAAD
jgi:methionine sulfoxide reductase heme-binding subunit